MPIDGYVHYKDGLEKKPSRKMFDKFVQKHNVKTKPLAYVGDNRKADGGLAKNINVPFIEVDANSPLVDEIIMWSVKELEQKRTQPDNTGSVPKR